MSVLSDAKNQLFAIEKIFKDRKAIAASSDNLIKSVRAATAGIETACNQQKAALNAVMNNSKAMDRHKTVPKADLCRKKAQDITAQLGVIEKSLHDLVGLLSMTENAIRDTRAEI